MTEGESDNFYHFHDNRVLPSHVTSGLAKEEGAPLTDAALLILIQCLSWGVLNPAFFMPAACLALQFTCGNPHALQHAAIRRECATLSSMSLETGIARRLVVQARLHHQRHQHQQRHCLPRSRRARHPLRQKRLSHHLRLRLLRHATGPPTAASHTHCESWQNPSCMMSQLGRCMHVDQGDASDSGTAFGLRAGAGRKIIRCELSVDGCKTWRLGAIHRAAPPNEFGKHWAWVFWEISIPLSAPPSTAWTWTGLEAHRALSRCHHAHGCCVALLRSV